jgi:CTP synthase (UTP-ammonia lyase)
MSLVTQILVLGDYDSRRRAHREADDALALFPADVHTAWAPTNSAAGGELSAVDGVWLMSGSPYRNDEAVYDAIGYCIERDTPFLGTCSGFQYVCLALARRHGFEAAHPETDPGATEMLIAPLACSLHGEHRLVEVAAGTRLAAICGTDPFFGFHNCGYGLAHEHEQVIEDAGAILSARAVDIGVTAVELPDHAFFIATAFHPQIGSAESGKLNVLLDAFIGAARDNLRDRKVDPPQPP